MKPLSDQLKIPCVGEPCVRVTADDVHAHLPAAEAEEEKPLGNAVDDDVESVVGGERTVKDGVGNRSRQGHPRIIP